jgi:hypothetical protein
MAPALHIIRDMKIINLLLGSLVALSACTDGSETDTAKAGVAPITAVSPTSKQLPQSDAVKLCATAEHAPTLTELQQGTFSECRATSIGFSCVPSAIQLVDAADIVDGRVWSGSPCVTQSAEHGFFVGDLGTGEITCTLASLPAAQPLCVR